MSLEQAACLGQVIAAFSVLGSLVFVGLQTRRARVSRSSRPVERTLAWSEA